MVAPLNNELELLAFMLIFALELAESSPDEPIAPYAPPSLVTDKAPEDLAYTEL